MSQSTHAGASVKGALETRPFPRLLLQLFRKRVTGTLTLRDEANDESRIYLREGCAVHIESSNELDRLDRMLLDSGMVSRAVMARAEERMKATGKRLGEVLIDLGAVDERVMHDTVKSQLRRKLKRLFFVRRGSFEVTVGEHAFGQGEDFARTRVDPRTLLYQGIRVAYDDARLINELAPLEGYSFKLIKLPPGFLSGMGIEATDPAVRALGTRALRLSDLTTLGGRPAELRAAVLSLLYADLLATERLDGTSHAPLGHTQGLAPLSPDRGASGHVPIYSPVPPAPAADSAPTAPLSSTQSAAVPAGNAVLRGRVEELFARLDRATHFELFELSESASPDQVNAAYMKAVKTFHPDRLSGLGLSDLLSKAERIMARLGEAKDVLSEPKRRNEYVRKLRGEKTETETARDILEAEELFKSGEVAMNRGEYTAAQRLFAQAAQKNPAETEYRAYLAWSRYMENPTRRAVLARETQRLIAEALRERPNFARGYFWHGEIAKHQGDMNEAESAYRKCLSLGPDFLDAERELRLIDIRRKKQEAGTSSKNKPDPPPGKGGGLLDKLLKR